MIVLGKLNTLKVNRQVDFGLYLGDETNEILLPTKYIPEGTKVGDKLKVFVYKDSEDRPIATTIMPLIMLDEFASLEVKEVNQYGAFMDWGLEKDLFVPYKEQAKRMRAGERHIVRLCMDYRTDRLIGVSKLHTFLERDTSRLEEKQQVDLLFFGETAMGYKVIINQKYQGLVYHNEVFDTVKVGDYRKGYIKSVREDGKVDVSLYEIGVEAINNSKNSLWDYLQNSPDGKIPLNDKSNPEQIKQLLGMSKKSFKKAVGGLYKEGKIKITQQGIVLINK